MNRSSCQLFVCLFVCLSFEGRSIPGRIQGSDFKIYEGKFVCVGTKGRREKEGRREKKERKVREKNREGKKEKK